MNKFRRAVVSSPHLLGSWDEYSCNIHDRGLNKSTDLIITVTKARRKQLLACDIHSYLCFRVPGQVLDSKLSRRRFARTLVLVEVWLQPDKRCVFSEVDGMERMRDQQPTLALTLCSQVN